MKQVEVTFNTPSGNESIKRINANDSQSIKSCVKSLAASLPNCWTVVKSEVVKTW